ncbi:uncharacterized protein LOC135210099 isoform X2 [Macrobrachium nipponense]|uniref:uncharacterized protein LOC135210099 isoform X2 n=1 Tax=Macrobrachium nipponense TaxID=159736 RepID=UPI0030C8D2C5
MGAFKSSFFRTLLGSLLLCSVGIYVCYIYLNADPDYHHLRNVRVWNSSHYYIHTPGCIMPEIEPFHPSLLKYKLKRPKQLVCSKKKPLTQESGLTLFFYKDRLHEYGVADNVARCVYQGILRVEQKPGHYNSQCDNKWKLRNESIAIEHKETLMTEDAVYVKCTNSKSKKSKPFYEAVHYFIQPWRVEEKRKQYKAKNHRRQNEDLSVILMGLDSVSRANLQRHMPATYDFVKNKLRLIEMEGFNKIAMNTDVNLSGILIGMYYEEVQSSCTPKESKTRFDDCPLIWKNFSAIGYPTAFGEDGPWMGSFHYRKHGFCKLPTDYYNRHYFYASEKLIGSTYGKRQGANYCQGGRSSISVIQDYSLEIAESLKDIPYFGYYWSASVTHGSVQENSMADIPTRDYLEKLSDRGYLNHTVLLFISDHGVRFGKITSTYAGMLELRLPFVMFGFPEWFGDKYPEAMRNLKTNTKRLTSSFDLHATLHDIVNKAYISPIERSYRSPLANHGQSLFLEVSENRTCAEAGIPDKFCACIHTKEVDTSDPKVQEAANKAVDVLNAKLRSFPDCAQLKLKRIVSGQLGYPRNETLPKQRDTLATSYVVTFITEPSEAEMEASFRLYEGKFELSADILRINSYDNQSHCITDEYMKNYCFCNDLVT